MQTSNIQQIGLKVIWSIVILSAFGLWIGMAHAQTSGWMASLAVTSGTTSFPLAFGGHPDATDGYDADLDVAAAPAGMTYYAYLETAQFPTYLSTDIRGWIAPYNANIDWTVKIVNASGKTSTVTWTPAELPSQGMFSLVGGDSPVNMRTQNSATFNGDKMLTIQYRPAVSQRWQVPLSVSADDFKAELIFGGDSLATAEYDVGMDVLAAPPGMTYYAYFEIPVFPNYLSTDLRGWLAPYQTAIDWTLKIVNAAGKTTSLVWDATKLPPQGSFTMDGLTAPVNMRLQDSVAFVGDKNVIIKYRFDLTGITVTSPNGGEKWSVGSVKTITWTNNNFADPVKIEYSTNNGVTWIRPPIATSAPNTGTFAWTIPNTPSASCKVRIADAADDVPSDVSDNVFEIGNFVEVWPPADTIGPANGVVLIPIFVQDVTNRGIISADLIVNTQPNVLAPLGATTQGTIAQPWGTPAVNINGGEIKISLAGSSALTGAGKQILVYIRYQVGTMLKATTPITLSKVNFNEGDPMAGPQNGKFTIVSYFSLSGNVKYFSNNHSVALAIMSLTGKTAKSTVSDTSGKYLLTDLAEGNYTLKPSKINAVGKAISSYDASLILRYSVGTISLTPYQKIAADVSGNDQVTSYDASLILQYCVGIRNQFPVNKDWQFVPMSFAISDLNWMSAPDSLTYQPLSADLNNQDFLGVVSGDVSGNWPATTAMASNVAATFVIDNITQPQEKQWLIPVAISFSQAAFSGSFKLEYDNSKLTLETSAAEDMGTGLMHAVGSCSGGLRCVFAANQDISNQGIKINFVFNEKNAITPSAADFKFTEVMVDDKVATVTGISDRQPEPKPTTWQLSQNHPNPFNAETAISFQVPIATAVKIEIFNLLGQSLLQLIDAEKEPGIYTVQWNGCNQQGQPLPSGIYIYRLEAGSFVASRKLALVR